MSIRAQIGYMNNEGQVRAIYSHSDGYVEGLGRMLVEHYNSHILANALIDMGGVFSIGKRINPPTDAAHGFDYKIRHKDTCVFYHRDRGNAWDENKPLRHANMFDFSTFAKEGWADFMYVWIMDAWHVSQGEGDPWVRVIDHPDYKDYEVTVWSHECYQRKGPLTLETESTLRVQRSIWRIMGHYDKLLATARARAIEKESFYQLASCAICDELVKKCACPEQWKTTDHRVCLGCGEYFNKTEADQVTCELCTIAVEQG